MKTAKDPFPRFITVEGGEGAGKTTLIALLIAEMTGHGIEVVRTREPGGTPLGDQIRRWLLGQEGRASIGDKAELLLFLAARAQHIEDVIKPALAAGKSVICDRYNDSTVAYQGAGRELGVDYVRGLCDTVCGDVLPGLTFYLDVDPVVGLQRTRKAAKEDAAEGQMDRIESEALAFHRNVREAFLAMAQQEPERFVVIDASKPLEEVSAALLNVLKERMGSSRT